MPRHSHLSRRSLWAASPAEASQNRSAETTEDGIAPWNLEAT